MYKIKSPQGFTLLELIIVVAIVAILASVAAPSFDELIKNNSVKALEHELNTSITFARSEALTRQKPVSIACVTSNSGGCKGDWSEGWVVFVDDKSGDYADGVLNTDEEILLSKANNGKATALIKDPDANSTRDGITFNYKGYSMDDSRASVVVCASSKEAYYARGLVLERSGRLMRSKDTTGDGVHEEVLLDNSGDVQSAALNCL